MGLLGSVEELLSKVREIVDTPEDTAHLEVGCPHPEDKVIEVTAMGKPATWKCLVCHEEQTVPFHNS